MYKRVIVKVGSGVLTKDNHLNLDIVHSLVNQIVSLRKRNIEVLLVTSGAVATGRGILSLVQGSDETIQKQVFAAVGQVKLMSLYAEAFAQHNFVCAQVLMTKEDFRDEQHLSNMKNCLESLLLDNVIPIANENDVIATTELMFTDNDELAGLIALQLNADALIILTSVDGILAGNIHDPNTTVVAEVPRQHSGRILSYITTDTSASGRGGMATKFTMARQLAHGGIVCHIANGKNETVLLDIIDGKPVGTKFLVT